MNKLIAIILLVSLAVFAEKGVFEVSGMKCQSCVKNLEKKVCSLPGVKLCEIELGKIVLTSEEGRKLDFTAIKKAIQHNDNYSVLKYEVTP